MIQLSENVKKSCYIIGYLLLILIIVGYIIYKNKSKEGFNQSSSDSSIIIKSFGTVLRDEPSVLEKALLFRAIKPSEKRILPSAYPENDINGDLWNIYHNYLSPIGNQQGCGSCWAWSTAGMLSDRFSLLSGGKIKVQMSPGKMVMCTFKFDDLSKEDLEKIWTDVVQRKIIAQKMIDHLKSQIACTGNDLYSALQELYTFGTTSGKCVPYNTINDSTAAVKYDLGASSDASNIPNCWDVIGIDFDTCVDQKTAARMYRAEDIYSLRDNEDDIMQEIYRWGPVSAGFKVYEQFFNNYDGKSIYMGPNSDENVLGGHAIRIVGWGEENNVKFWWIANSWSNKWGMNGYFRMKKMIPQCQLEQNVVGLKPEFPGKSVWDITLDIVQPIDSKLKNFPGHQLDRESL